MALIPGALLHLVRFEQILRQPEHKESLWPGLMLDQEINENAFRLARAADSQWGLEEQIQGHVGITGLDEVRALDRYGCEIDCCDMRLLDQHQQIVKIRRIL